MATDLALSGLRPGEKAVIRHVRTTSPRVKQRLMELGMTRGSSIELIRVAPMGDPLEVKIRGYRLSLRKVEAEAIVVGREM
jgi:Fe2+ transport system protein FeoA